MTNNLLAGLAPVHPGEFLREDVFPALNKPMAEFARLLSTSRTTLYAIMNGEQAVTSDMACKIAADGTAPELWMSLQATYDLRMSEAALRMTRKDSDPRGA